jgi:hypothetical protein
MQQPFDDRDSGNFPAGIVVFFRLMTADGSLARSVHPAGRAVLIGRGSSYEAHPEDYSVLDGNGRILGCFPRDFVSAILPIDTVGPGAQPDANSPPKVPHH